MNCQALRFDYLSDGIVAQEHGVERSDSGGDPGLGPGNQVTHRHKHGVRKHVRLGVQGESAWLPRYAKYASYTRTLAHNTTP